MKTFKQYFFESYSVFPKTAEEISALGFPSDNVENLFNIIKSYPNINIEDPIGLDTSNFNNIKITRSLGQDVNFINYLQDKLGININTNGITTWNNVKIRFGEGSRGGRGAASQGASFEKELEQDLNNFNAGNEEIKYIDLVNSIVSRFQLEPGNFETIPEGFENKSRPLQFTSSGPVIGHSGRSVADTLTDITIKKGDEYIYLSLKYGNQVTFFNSGIAKILPAKEIQQGAVKNKNGILLLDTLGIDNELFCRVFNEYGDTDFSEHNVPSQDYDKQMLFNLVSSGVGEGYYMVHCKKHAQCKFELVDKTYNSKASTITTPVSILYGGIKGTGKRLDLVFESEVYKFKINIRNKGGKLYPTHLMCDYAEK
jgi:hypothetical protein